MSQNSISTYSLSSSLIQTIQASQAKLSKTQIEISTGRYADVGLALGSGTAAGISLRQQENVLKTITTTNGIASTRLDTTQSVLSSIGANAQSFLESLLGATSATGDPAVLQASAQVNLQSLTASLNTTLNGDYLFGGVNSGQQPITDYSAPGSLNGNALDQAFQTTFGISQSDSAVSSITASNMQNFLDSSFANLFQGTNWSTNWSQASDTVLTTQINDHQTANTSVSANEKAFKELFSAYTMIGQLGTANLNSSAFKTVVNQAVTTVKSAISDLTNIQGGVGLVQNQIVNANDTMSLRMNYLTSQVNTLESVDPAEASTRMTALQTQIETAYSLTSQLHKLSLVNYL